MNKNKFLLGIANKVANLLANQANQNQFKKYSRDFQKKRTAFKKATRQWRKKKWKGYNDASGQKLLRLDPKRKLMTGRNAILPTNRKEQLWRSYIWLIIIHDWQRPSDVPIDNTTDEPLKEFKGIIENILTDTGETHPIFKQENESGKHYIESVLKEVKADLVSKQKKNAEKPTQPSSGKAGDIRKRFRFNKAQAFFDEKDLRLPAGAEIDPVKILKMLVQSFGGVVPYENMDENSVNTASIFLRGKIRTIRCSLKKHKVPCKIQPKKWSGYVLSNSRVHS